MKIAIFSDVHANYEALQAVVEDIENWRPDLVVCAGDLINRGPRPLECLEYVWQRVQQGNWYWLRGNHEDYVIAQSRADAPQHGPEADVHHATRWTLDTLQRASASKTDYVALVRGMPYHLRLADPNGDEVLITHGSMNGTRDGVYPETSDQELHGKIFPKQVHANGGAQLPDDRPKTGHHGGRGHIANGERIRKYGLTLPGEYKTNPALSLFAVGHTHRPLVRCLNGSSKPGASAAETSSSAPHNLLVVNAGSAGLPFDRDTHPSYARLEYQHNAWQCEIVRFSYDIARAEQDFFSTGYIEGAGPLTRLVLIELQQARSQLFQWTRRFQAQALSGEMSMEETVERSLQDGLDWVD